MKELISNVQVYGLEESIIRAKYPMSVDVATLNSDVTKGIAHMAKSGLGQAHDQFLTGITVQFDLTCSNKMWVEVERYRFMFFVSSQSTMHRMCRFNLDEAYDPYTDKRAIAIVKELVGEYNNLEDKTSEHAKDLYLRILHTNPAGFLITAGMTTNYRQLKTIYAQRKEHKLPQWREFCRWVETLPMSEFITGGIK